MKPIGVGLTQNPVISLSPSLIKEGQVNNARMVVSPCGTDQATSMASSWVSNLTDQDELIPEYVH